MQLELSKGVVTMDHKVGMSQKSALHCSVLSNKTAPTYQCVILLCVGNQAWYQRLELR